MVKRILLGLGAGLILLIGVLLLRTLNYGGAPQDVPEILLPETPAFDADRIAERLGEAIRFKTVTVAAGDPRVGQEGPWLALQAWMENTYPAFHGAASKETIPGGYSLLFTWTGSDPALDPILLMAHQDVVPVNIGTEGDGMPRLFQARFRTAMSMAAARLMTKAQWSACSKHSTPWHAKAFSQSARCC